MQTLDNLLVQGRIPTSEYLRRLPSGQIADRESLIALLRAQEDAAKGKAENKEETIWDKT